MYFRKRVVIQFVSIQFLIAKRKEKSPKKKKEIHCDVRCSIFIVFLILITILSSTIIIARKILQFLQIRFTKYKLEIKNRERLKTTA